MTRRSVRSIALRAFDSASKWAVVREPVRIYAITLGAATLGDDSRRRSRGEQVFDPVKMGEIYELGYETARKGPPWSTVPPSLRQTDAP
jgi:hypothetical protein